MKKVIYTALMSWGLLTISGNMVAQCPVPLFEVNDQFISVQEDATKPWITNIFRGDALWLDMNNDDQIDLFTAAQSMYGCWSSTVMAWLNKDGIFTPVENLPFKGISTDRDSHRGGYEFATEAIDFNNDGNVDILLRGITVAPDWSQAYFFDLYKGNGDGTFELVENSGLEPIATEKETGYANITVATDFNSDGYMDISVIGVTGDINGEAQYDNMNRVVLLYRNNGDGTFTKLTDENTFVDIDGAPFAVNISSGRLAWGDYNNDGFPDFAVNGWGNGPTLYIGKNNGDCTFTIMDMSISETEYCPAQVGTQKGALAWGDFNNDGWLDLLVTGETFDGENWGRVADILLNRGNDYENISEYPESQFQRMTSSSTGISAQKMNGIDLVDIDNNGYLDIIMAGESAGAEFRFVMNKGDMTFYEDNFSNPTIPVVRSGSSADFFDYDKDGYIDCFAMGFGTDNARFRVMHNRGVYEDKEFKEHAMPLNTRPDAPKDVTVSEKDGRTIITWSAGSDKETGTAALRYNVCIEKKNGETFMLAPANLTTGQLKTARLSTLIQGTKYVSTVKKEDIKEVWVQTVDGGKMTSAFCANTTGVDILSYQDNAIIVKQNGHLLQVEANTNANVSIYNTAGSQVLFESIKGTSFIDCSGLNGIYIIEVNTIDHNKTIKMIF